MPIRKTVETSYGAVDEKTLERLQNRFDTRRLLDAVDAIDLIRERADGLRQDLLDLHSMAAEVINEDGSRRVAREEPIWELHSESSSGRKTHRKPQSSGHGTAYGLRHGPGWFRTW